jgi:uncharacterized protein YhhL (DUF1145 family)
MFDIMIKSRPYEAIFWQILVTFFIVVLVYTISGPFWATLATFIASIFLTLIWTDEMKIVTEKLDKFTPLSDIFKKIKEMIF